MPDLNGSRVWNVVEVASKGAILIILALCGLTWNEIRDVRALSQANSREVARLQSGQFTARDGLDVWKEIGELKAQVAKLTP